MATMVAIWQQIEIFKMAAILNIRSSLEVLGPAGVYALRTYGQGLLPILILILTAWIVVPMLITHLIFRKRGGL